MKSTLRFLSEKFSQFLPERDSKISIRKISFHEENVRSDCPRVSSFSGWTFLLQVIIFNITHHIHVYVRFPSAKSLICRIPVSPFSRFSSCKHFCAISREDHVFLRKYGREKRLRAYVCTHSRLLRKDVCFASLTPFVMTRRRDNVLRLTGRSVVYNIRGYTVLCNDEVRMMHLFFYLQHHSHSLSWWDSHPA